MRKFSARENVMGAAILALLFFLIFVLPVLVGEAPPVLTAGGLAAFVAAHLVLPRRRSRGTAPLEVTLEPLAPSHLMEVKSLWRDPDVIRYTNIPDLCRPEEVTERLERLLACQAILPGPTIFAVLRDGRFCGIAGCPAVDAEQGIFGLFYQLFPACWGQGVGRTAARLTLEALIRQVPAATVLADTAAENIASVCILEGLGFTRRAVRPGAFQRDGQTVDIWEYIRREVPV